MSDTLNSLPCWTCGGTGKARRHKDRQLEQIDALIDSVRQIQRIKRRLREAGIDTGSGFNARGLLSFAEDALRDHLAAINAPGGAKCKKVEIVESYETSDILETLEGISTNLDAAILRIDKIATTLPGKLGDAFDMMRLARITILEAMAEITDGGNNDE